MLLQLQTDNGARWVKNAHPVAVFNAQDHFFPASAHRPVQLKRELRGITRSQGSASAGLLPQRRQRRQLVRAHLFRPLHGAAFPFFMPAHFQFRLMIKRK